MAHDPRKFVLRAFTNREIRDLMMQVFDQGTARVEMARNPSHGVVVYGLPGTRPYPVHATISGARAVQNVRAQLRRIGALET